MKKDPLATLISEARKEFQRIFVTENIWKSDNEDTAYAGIGNVESFIFTTYTQKLLEGMKEKVMGCLDEVGKLKGKNIEERLYAEGFNSCLSQVRERLLAVFEKL